MSGTAKTPGVSTWAPLALTTFRVLWIAQLISNVGTWMQNLGAQWMLVSRPDATALTAMAQAAGMLPVLFLSLPAGVLADIFNRRTFLILTQIAAIAVVTTLTVLTATGGATPSVVILLTFALGITTALASPAWQAIQPQLVPRELIPAAAALAGLSMNTARAIGPAVGGALLAVTSPAVLFGLNAISTVFVVAALIWWRPSDASSSNPERVLAGLRSGGRYVLNSPATRRILLRTGLFILPASALWALLAVISADRLRLGAGGYGLMLGALGGGAMLGALMLDPIRARFSSNALMITFSLLYAVGMAGAAVVDAAPVVLALMVVAGVGWLVMLTAFNSSLQLRLSDWVRARGMATYLMVFLGGQGIGAVIWGAVGQRIGATEALLVAVVLMLAGAATVPLWPMPSKELDLSIGTPLPDPVVDLEPDPLDGPVLVQVTYRVAEERLPAFLSTARQLERVRRRTGASEWGLYQDVADHCVYIESFLVPTWEEHLRQHYERTTTMDAAVIEPMHRFVIAGDELEDRAKGRHLLSVSLQRPSRW